MADNKNYYYLRLKDNFFETDEMLVLESMQDGHLYSNILLKLYLRSLKNEGRLMFNDRIPYNSTILSQITRHSVGVVEKAISIFSQLGLIEILDNGAIYMLDIQNFIGKTTTEADRIRDYQRRIKEEKKQIDTKSVENYVEIYEKSTPELEIEIEIEKDNNNMCVLEEKEKPKSKNENAYPKEFEQLWNEYPRRREKKKAYKAYQARLKEKNYTHEQMLDAVKGYAKECKKKKTEEQFIKLPSTFFGPNTNFEDYYQKQTFESGQVKTEKFTSATDYARENNLTLKDIDCPFD